MEIEEPKNKGGRPKGTKGIPRKGGKTGGRIKGSPWSKKSLIVEDILNRLQCDPIEGMALIAMGKIPCGACAVAKKGPTGKTRVKAADGTFYERTCESCYGTLLEKVSPETRAKMYAELAQYRYPKRKAIEHTGADGAPLHQALTVEFVKAPDAK